MRMFSRNVFCPHWLFQILFARKFIKLFLWVGHKQNAIRIYVRRKTITNIWHSSEKETTKTLIIMHSIFIDMQNSF